MKPFCYYEALNYDLPVDQHCNIKPLFCQLLEDSPDHGGARAGARVKKLVRKCTCHTRSVLRKRVGEEVLFPTLIIKKFNTAKRKQVTRSNDKEVTEPVITKSSPTNSLTRLFRGCFLTEKSVEVRFPFRALISI